MGEREREGEEGEDERPALRAKTQHVPYLIAT